MCHTQSTLVHRNVGHADQKLARHAELDLVNGETESSHAPADLPVLKNTAPEPIVPPAPEPVSVSSPQITSEESNAQPQETGKCYPARIIKPPCLWTFK